MSTQLSSNTQAILLLTAPLIAGKKEEAAPLLKPAEYNRLARLLVTKGKQPADLLAADAAELIADCEAQFGQGRIKDLLGRAPMIRRQASMSDMRCNGTKRSTRFPMLGWW